MQLSIIIITHLRPQLITSCLRSLFKNPPKVSFEVIVILNGSDQSTEEILKQQTFFKKIKLVSLAQSFPATARNFGISLAQGKWILFLDDDVEIPEHYFDEQENLLKLKPNATVLGGPDQTPINSSYFSQCVGEVLTSPLATGQTRHRHSKAKTEVRISSENELILCHLWIKKDFLQKHQLAFDQRFFRNEENVLIYQLKNNGAQIIYSPNLYVYHYRKNNFRELYYPLFRSGFYRIKSIHLFPQTFDYYYVIPSLFVLYLFSLIFIHNSVYFLPIIFYLLLNTFYSIFLQQRNKKRSFKRFQLYFLLHFYFNFIYGLGQLSYVFKTIKKSFKSCILQLRANLIKTSN